MAAPDAPAKLLPPLESALDDALCAALTARRQPADTAPAEAWVLQWLLTREGIWQALCPRDRLSSPWPGGAHHARRDDAAPSRSTLKLEEALALMDDPPRPRARAIDLGAAPGGWSYALLKRGCRVLAVDNGPLTIEHLDELPGELTHLRADGMTFKPPAAWLPADWWVSDMLVPPGKALGLLRRWLGQGWCRRFVVNFKLPQANPLPALAPVQDYLASLAGVRWHLRHLYHDRQEVTLFGWLDARQTAAQPGAERHAPGRKPAGDRVPGQRPAAKAGRPAPRPSRRGRGRGTRRPGGRP
jgi:23S rRNA (cytidine2498-2'-O)-methyltransferase